MKPLERADYQARVAAQMTEKHLQDTVLELATRLGWLSYHTFDSRRSTPGFPDLVMVHNAQRRLLVAELKTQTGRLGTFQQGWLTALTAAHVETHVWRPADLLAGTIRDHLTRPPPALAGDT